MRFQAVRISAPSAWRRITALMKRGDILTERSDANILGQAAFSADGNEAPPSAGYSLYKDIEAHPLVPKAF